MTATIYLALALMAVLTMTGLRLTRPTRDCYNRVYISETATGR